MSDNITLHTELEQAGLKALDEFLETFNGGDPMAWAATMQYPHVRIAGGKVQIWNTPEEYARDNDVRALRDASNWAYTVWDWRKMVQADAEKLHFAVQFSRYTADHKKIVSYESFYIMTKVNDRWGTQFRSSYAGVIVSNTAF